MTAELPDIPWHAQGWRQLQLALGNARLPHALLVTGPMGVGKRAFVERLTAVLLCQQCNTETMRPCGNCPGCQKTSSGAHPDYRHTGIPEDKREITVDEVRNLLKYIQLSAQVGGGYKLAVIDPADSMNRSAANALLKTLEEPPANRLIVLISEAPGRLPATIRSRCQLLRIPSPDTATALRWLGMAVGKEFDPQVLEENDDAPLRALEAVLKSEAAGEGSAGTEGRQRLLQVLQGKQPALDLARQWADVESQQELVRWLQREILGALRILIGQTHSDQAEQSRNAFIQADMDLLAVLNIQNIINNLAHTTDTTLNKRLLWETFLLNCLRMREKPLPKSGGHRIKETA